MKLKTTKMEVNYYYSFIFLLLLLSFSATGQVNSAVLAKADTSGFRPNRQGGWILYNSYVAKGQDDSVSFEVIIQHSKTGIDWSNDQYIGLIKTQALLPPKDKIISYTYPGFGDIYTLKISRNGMCYLSLAGGSSPSEDPVVIYVQVKY